MIIRQRHRSATRVVGYDFESDADLETATDDLMTHELNQSGTPVTQYGTDGRALWFNGVPGKRMRNVVERVKRLGWRTTTRRGHE